MSYDTNSTSSTIEALKSQRSALVGEKGDLISDLDDIKSRLAVTMPRAEFQAENTRRRILVRRMRDIDSRICAINSQISSAANAEALQRAASKATSPPDTKSVMGLIIDMRNEYQSFASDATRSPTMRRMASEFIGKLNPIIRKALNSTD